MTDANAFNAKTIVCFLCNVIYACVRELINLTWLIVVFLNSIHVL